VSVPYPNAITQLTTTLTVPPAPPATGAVIIWPGLVPCCSGSNPTNPTFLPIGLGTLQAELSWGPTLAPTTQPSPYSTWWISGQYNNFAGSETGYIGPQSGSAISVNPGDSLVESLTLSGTVWNEHITDATTGQSANFQIDLLGQTQNELFFYMQGNGQNPVGAVTFTNTSFTTSSALSSASACALSNAGTVVDDTQSTPTLSGNTCSIANITLLPAASPVPALRTHAPSAAVRFPQPSLPARQRG
jgi:hypothetical protein